MTCRGLGSFPHFLFLLLFQDAILITYAHQPPDHEQELRYGEPTIFVIKRVKNRTSDEEFSHQPRSLVPLSRFEPYYRTEFNVLILLVLGCLILFIILGNALVVGAVFLERSLQRFSNYLIVSLAIADLMVGIVVMPLSALDEISNGWFLGVSLCNFWIVMDVLCCTASILHLVAIAIDRYWAVTRADYSRQSNKKVILGMIFVVWFTSICISLPSRFTFTDSDRLKESVLSDGVCIINPNKIYTVFSTAGAFFLPMTFLICIYSKIYVSARQRIRKQNFKWLKYPSSETNKITNCTSVITLTDAAALSSLPTSSLKPLTNNKKQVASIEAEYHRYSDKDTYLPSPAIWIDDGEDVEVEDDDDDIPCDITHSVSRFPRPTNESTIQSPVIPQSPIPTPSFAFNYSHLTSPAHSSIPLHPFATAPPSPPFSISRSTPIPPQTQLQKENGYGISSHLSKEFKRKHAFDAGIGLSFMSIKRRLLNKQLSVATIEAVFARRERMEHRRERRASRTLAIITGCFLLCWIPFSVNALVQPLCGESCALPPAGEKFFLWLGYLNSLLNPIIYTIFSPDYRKAFVKTLTCRFCRDRR